MTVQELIIALQNQINTNPEIANMMVVQSNDGGFASEILASEFYISNNIFHIS